MRVILSLLLSLALGESLASAALQWSSRFAYRGLQSCRLPFAPGQVRFCAAGLGSVVRFGGRALDKGVFCIPTYDGTFGHMMTDELVRKDFIENFVPGAKVVSSKLLGTALNPVHRDSSLTTEANNIIKLQKLIAQAASFELSLDGKVVSPSLHQTLVEVLKDRDDATRSFASLKDAQMDVLCEVEYEDVTQGTVLAEVQVAIPDYSWDTRTEYYAAGLFARQLKRGDDYKSLKNVVCVNILGGASRAGRSRGLEVCIF